MSDNIVVSLESLPNELWANIALFLDPESQRALSLVNHHFEELTIAAVYAQAKAELMKFKERLMEQVGACCALYEREIVDLRNAKTLIATKPRLRLV
jgi:hypothetical protein